MSANDLTTRTLVVESITPEFSEFLGRRITIRCPDGVISNPIFPSSGTEYRWALEFPTYIVGNEGDIWSYRKTTDTRKRYGREPSDILQYRVPHIPEDGYPRVMLYPFGDKTYVVKKVAHLVLETFVGPRPDGMESCHDPDPDRLNNRLSNLRWDTRRENVRDFLRRLDRDGRPYPSHNHRRGSDASKAKLRTEQVLEIRRRTAMGEIASALATEFGVTSQSIYAIINRESWRHLP